MGFTGIGRPQHRGNSHASGASVTIGRRREGNGHLYPVTELLCAASPRRPLADEPCMMRRFMSRFGWLGCVLYHTATGMPPALELGNESRTNRGRIGDSRTVRFVHGHMWRHLHTGTTKWGDLVLTTMLSALSSYISPARASVSEI